MEEDTSVHSIESIEISSDSEQSFFSDEISVSEGEWNQSILELDECVEKVGNIEGNSVELNEEFEKQMGILRELMRNNDYTKVKQQCETMLSGNLKYRCENAEFWLIMANSEKKIGTPDSVIEIYDRGCEFLKGKSRQLITLSLEMRSYVEDIVGEEEAVEELDLPLSKEGKSKKSSRAQAMISFIKKRELQNRLVSEVNDDGEISSSAIRSPSRPEGKSRRTDSNNSKLDEEALFESTKIILTPIKATKSQQRKHKCDMILSPVRKSARLMKNNSIQDIVGDKLIETTYAYTNNKCIVNKQIDS